MSIDLFLWGLTPEIQNNSAFAQYDTARIVAQYNEDYRIICENGFFIGSLAGQFRFSANTSVDLPAVGDWVYGKSLEDFFLILGVFPRKTKLSRKRPGKDEEQMVASNIDILFLVQGLDENFNPRRMERLVVLTKESGAQPIVILTKADIAENLTEKIAATKEVSAGAPVHALCSLEKSSIDVLRQYMHAGITAGFIGSSGVGKSTLINGLLGENKQETQEVRMGDRKGKHTTTVREIFLLQEGGLLLDTPGMKEIGLWSAQESVDSAFPEIESLSAQCKFKDCLHEKEPGCAVLAALADGSLSQERYQSYEKLKREVYSIQARTDPILQREKKEKWKKIRKDFRALNKEKNSMQ